MITNKIESFYHPPSKVTVKLLSSIEVQINGERQETPRPQVVNLLVAILLARPGRATREHCFRWVFDDEPNKASLKKLPETMGHLRVWFKPIGLADMLKAENGQIWLDLDENRVEVDERRFRWLISQAKSVHTADQAEARTLYREALELSNHDPLPGLRGSQVELFRHKHRQQRVEALDALAKLDMNQGDYMSAAGSLNTLHHLDKQNQDIAARYGIALAKTGQASLARAVLDEIVTNLNKNTIPVQEAVLTARRKIQSGEVTPTSEDVSDNIPDNASRAVAAPNATDGYLETGEKRADGAGSVANEYKIELSSAFPQINVPKVKKTGPKIATNGGEANEYNIKPPNRG